MSVVRINIYRLTEVERGNVMFLVKSDNEASNKKTIDWRGMGHIMIIVMILLYFTVDRIRYVMGATANVPVMDYWRYIVQFVDKLYQGELSLVDLWVPQEGGAHRAIGMPIFFFLLNAKYFSLNTRIEIILGAVATLINCLFVLYIFLKKMKWDNNVIKYGFIFIAMCMFNINQWEILVLEFSLGFAVRVLLVLLMFNCFDSFQRNDNKVTYGLYLIYGFMLACLTGSYAPGVLGAVVFVTLVQIIVEKDNKYKILLKNIIIILVFSLGITFFFKDLGGGTGDSLGANIMDFLFDGSVVKAVLYMLGSSILHTSSNIVLQNKEVLLYAGAVLFFLYMIAIYLFFKRQMYKKTYFPIMLMAYTACIILVISVGRIPMYGIYYVTSSRYVVETTLGLCGICWIFINEINIVCKKDNFLKIKGSIINALKVSVCSFGLLFILMNFTTSYETEMNIGPYRKIYQENLIEIMNKGEKITSEKATLFQSDSIYVNEGIEIMKKYKLGIYKE